MNLIAAIEIIVCAVVQTILMDNYWYTLYILFLSIVTLCHCQTNVYITEPKLTSVIPINSTAITVTWQFAGTSIDQSDLIRIYIVFYEYYYAYNYTYASNNYTFVASNKTVTSLTKNFELVNAYYYVCFSSNSTYTNSTLYVSVVNKCILTRTCSRSNTTCSGPSSVTVSSTSISSNSFIISFFWPIDLPYSSSSFIAQLINNGQTGTALSSTQNASYITRPYQFTSLQSRTTYTVNTSFSFTINGVTNTNVTTVTVTTSCSAKFCATCDLSFIFFTFSVILSTLFF